MKSERLLTGRNLNDQDRATYSRMGPFHIEQAGFQYNGRRILLVVCCRGLEQYKRRLGSHQSMSRFLELNMKDP